MKKAVSIILAFVLAFGMLISASASDAKTDKSLQFDKDGNFRILQIADIQDGVYLTPATKRFIKESIAYSKPDLIILTGDNTSGGATGIGIPGIDDLGAKIAVNNIMSVLEEAGVPVAVAFGNHDAEHISLSKEELLAIYNSYDCCVAIDEGADIYGCGTYNLPVYSASDPNKIAYNIWITDSNMYDEVNGGYDYVHEDQIAWYVSKSNELKAQNGGEPVPSMMFQHIVVPEIFDALLEVPEGTENSYEHNDKYYVLNPENTKAGVLHETPCPSKTNSGQFTAALNQGDVVAMFFGHDHKNTYEISYKGIDLVCTPGVGFGSYGDEGRGVRVIDIKEGTRDYETYIIEYLDFYSADDYALECFKLYGNEFDAGEKFSAFFKILYLGIKAILSF